MLDMESFGSYINKGRFIEILNKLSQLVAEKRSFPISEISIELLPAFKKFIIGMTCPIHEGKKFVYHGDYLLFYRSLCGIDSDVGFD